MSEVLFRFRTKATDREGDRLRFSLNWLWARRGELRFTDRSIECGDWIIPYESIDDAVLLVIPTLLFTAYNIRAKSRGKTDNFQLTAPSVWGWQQDPFLVNEAPFAIRREFGQIGF